MYYQLEAILGYLSSLFVEYEIEYDRIAKGKPKDQFGVFTYEDIKKFFEACGQYPSRKEVEDAIKLALEGMYNYCKISFQLRSLISLPLFSDRLVSFGATCGVSKVKEVHCRLSGAFTVPLDL